MKNKENITRRKDPNIKRKETCTRCDSDKIKDIDKCGRERKIIDVFLDWLK